MSALVEQQNTQGAPAAGQNNQVNGNSLMRISAGPAALAQKLIYEVMALYSEITKLEGEQKNEFIQAQSEEASAQASATKKAGWEYAGMMIASGALTIASAAGSTALGAGVGMNREEMTNAQNKIGGLEAEKAPIMKIDALEQKVNASTTGTGGKLEGEPAEHLAALKGGQFPGDYKEDDMNTALAELKADSVAYKAYKENKQAQLERISKDINSQTSEMQRLQTKWGVWSQLVSGSLGGVSKGLEGAGAAMKADQDASASLASAAAGMASQEQGVDGQAMSTAFNAQNQEVQILEKIDQANHVQA